MRGKRNENLVLPLNDSVSVTLDQKHMRAKTTVARSGDFKKDRLWLNGKEEEVNARVQKVLAQKNNFPTAAGLASSAAGYAAMAFSLSKLYGYSGPYNELSRLARVGSGSACRSMCGGFVKWAMGSDKKPHTSISCEIAKPQHWPQFRVLILVVKKTAKAISSSEGMNASVATSKLLEYRVKEIVPERVKSIVTAIQRKDIINFAELTMQDSNQLHAICLDTFPPISYLTDVSHQIIAFVHEFNKRVGQNRVAYTFDAGPNACLFLLEHDIPRVVALLRHLYCETGNDDFVTGNPVSLDESEALHADISALENVGIRANPGAVKYLIHTQPGPEPILLEDPEDSLLDETGWPKDIKKDE